jgi:hypothetical protein
MAVLQQLEPTRGEIWLVEYRADLADLYPSHGDEAFVVNEKEWYKYEVNAATWRRLVTFQKSDEALITADGYVAESLTEGVK